MPYKDPGLMGLWMLTHMKKANEILYIKSSQLQGCALHGEICLNACFNSLCGYLRLSHEVCLKTRDLTVLFRGL